MENFLITKNLKRATIGCFKHYVLYDSLRKKAEAEIEAGLSISIIISLLNLNKEERGGPTFAYTFN